MHKKCFRPCHFLVSGTMVTMITSTSVDNISMFLYIFLFNAFETSAKNTAFEMLYDLVC